MSTKITITGDGDYLLGGGERKVISMGDTSGATVDIVYPVGGSVYQFTGAGAREVFLQRENSQSVSFATVSGFAGQFDIILENVVPDCDC